ncbi:MAG: hypothetical protein IJ867_04260 [Clostridia bacterium]|nr:hypothetical protein [Clostridia bacterium]
MNNVQNELNILDEISKGATMGVDAIKDIKPKVKDRNFLNVLDTEEEKYHRISDRLSSIYKQFSDKDPHTPSQMEKTMTSWGIEMRTMTDDTTSKLAELLVKGTNMGIIEGRRLLNHNPNASSQVHSLLEEFVTMQEDSVETLKKYL